MGDPEFERIKREGEHVIAQAQFKRMEISLAKLTDKGAKDFKEGMTAMDKAGKAGAFAGLALMLNKLMEASPAIDIISMFLERITAIFVGDIDWATIVKTVGELAEKLEAIYEAAKAIIALDFDKFWENILKLISDPKWWSWWLFMKNLFPTVFEPIEKWASDMGYKIEELNFKFAKFILYLRDTDQVIKDIIAAGPAMLEWLMDLLRFIAGGGPSQPGGDWWEDVPNPFF